MCDLDECMTRLMTVPRYPDDDVAAPCADRLRRPTLTNRGLVIDLPYIYSSYSIYSRISPTLDSRRDVALRYFTLDSL
eukprot:6963418-Pyramimonas_sp.AAC.2